MECRVLLVTLALAGCDRVLGLLEIPVDAAPTACEPELTDNFDDNSIGTQWFTYADQFAKVTEEGGEAVLDLGEGNVEAMRMAEYVSFDVFDLRGRHVSVELTRISNPLSNLQAVLFGWTQDGLNAIALFVERGKVFCLSHVGPSYTQQCNGPTYNAMDHRYLGIREEAGGVHFEVSADRAVWNKLDAFEPTFAIDSLQFGMYVFMAGAGVDAGHAAFDNFVLCKLQ